jgi:diguanylate cyclase (GGDEF)-like protein
VQPAAGPAKDLVGFLSVENGEPLLDDAQEVYPAQTPSPDFRSVHDVHQLSANLAALHLPVRVTATVTYSDPASGRLFVQDSTDAIFVSLTSPRKVPLRPGDLVQIRGETSPGDFAAIIINGAVTVVGRHALPAPETDFESAFAGYKDCLWTEVGGVIEDVAKNEFDVAADVILGDHRFVVHILAPVEKVRLLIDHEIRLRGAVGGLFNGQRQILGIQMFIPGIEFVRDISRVGVDPWHSPARDMASLLQFSPGQRMGHRVRVTGVVTLANPHGPTSLRDHTGALLVASHELSGVTPGDLVDVVGFARAGKFGPEMRNASIRKLQSGVSLAPLAITPAEAMTGSYESQLVRMDGAILSVSLEPIGLSLRLRSGAYIFGARVPLSASSANPALVADVAPGAQVRLTGICSMILDQSTEVQVLRGFDLSLRSPADIQVMRPAPWLTQARLLLVLAGASGLVLAAVFWILLLRRSVRRQTSSLERANKETIEALRRAREAESLEQGRKAILELVARDEPLERILSALAAAVVSQIPGGASLVQLALPDGAHLAVSHGLPEAIEQEFFALDRSGTRPGDSPSQVAGFSGDPVWCGLLDALGGAFPTCREAPIVRGGRALGAVVALSPAETTPRGQDDDLVSWANLAGLAAERRGLYDQLSFRARHDTLTSLCNREALYESLQDEMVRSIRDGSHTAVLYFDLDKFKQINDRFGHDAGDAVLIEVAHRIRSNIRRTDIAARLGGDEFVVVLPALSGREEAVRIGALITSAVREPFEWAHLTFTLEASLGISLFPVDADTADELIKAADQGMYRAKSKRIDFAPL